MFHYKYRTKNTCSQTISFDLDGDIVHNVEFRGGCDGNLKAVPLLVEGQTVDYIIQRLSGVQCGRRGTSCADQLTKALAEGLAAEQAAQA